MVLVAIGVSLYFSNNNATDEASVYIETEEFNQFTHTAGGKTYDYYVQAKSLDSSAPSWLLPNSNVDSVYSVYEDSPQYGYLTYATVTKNKQVELNYYRDTASPIKSYTVLQGETETTLAPIAVINANTLVGQERLNFTDNAADVNAREYYYQVTSRNDCGNLTSSSNLGRTIHLVVENDDEGLRNTLRWNKYVDWDSTVAYYNIYRTLSPFYSTTVYQQVAPDSLNDFNVFVDNISDATTSNGKFYYRVEAVQGPVLPSAVNGFPNNLTSAVSNSNIAEALQNPLMYVPNAFAPDGINNTFGPKGQFFDYTQFEMTIYNRWGEQVHLTNDINQAWDGTVDGKDASSGTYVYIIRYKDGEGKEKSKKGTLTLIR